ncbi:YibE/F family protein [Apilactobacillus xinyiensis]|uniref:YibE/F family protein n=1 Tax=Apilactobacillus xinyiensis TaxID=2841032 RepID=A0ABT0I0R7_9LACO|nr:YibE/F family protein [Apilactobacillus xinyiensis]MCK8624443.1 YibE/F family protein [Apilactobacillus xinyiensis]MCL0312037.1 YibE/F family protein [Apilactobacillus xinyiensis]MCL0318690.1 YibE/F family protein [Apilactobacillus xinyiensis]
MSSIALLGIILLFLMLLVGGRQGFNSFISLILNFGFLFLAIVLISFHLSPLLVTLVVGTILLSLTIFLSGVNDETGKLAFYSSLFVLIILVVLIIPIEYWSQVQGFGLEDSDDLEGMSLMIGISFVKISIATAILSTLGAIAEATMAIASGLGEITEQHPDISSKRLLFDGFFIGKQIIGTTLNTLFFGLFGGMLALFIWFFGLNYSFGNILNDKVFNAEFIIILFSLIGVILSIPITSAVIAHNWKRKHN